MAGTLTISTLSDGTNSTSTTNLTKAPCVAWANWNGSGGATIRASYNVSSVTRNSTGNYTVNFTNALADANYSIVFGKNINNSISSSDTVIPQGYAVSSTQCAVGAVTYQGTFYDMQTWSIACFR